VVVVLLLLLLFHHINCHSGDNNSITYFTLSVRTFLEWRSGIEQL
jgi:hypothetical protein